MIPPGSPRTPLLAPLRQAMSIDFGDFRNLVPPSKADAVITDPPYNIGHDYGPVNDRLPEVEYAQIMAEFAQWAWDNTAPNAHLFIIHYPKFFFQHGGRLILAGWEYRQQIRWCYPSNIGHSRNKFTTASREILWLTKGDPFFDAKGDPEPYLNPNDRRVRSLIKAGSPGRAPYDWWQIDLQKNVSSDHVGYANQLPKALLRRIIRSATLPGQLILDPFAGTGSTLLAASELGRSAWGCDANPNAPVFNLVPP